MASKTGVSQIPPPIQQPVQFLSKSSDTFSSAQSAITIPATPTLSSHTSVLSPSSLNPSALLPSTRRTLPSSSLPPASPLAVNASHIFVPRRSRSISSMSSTGSGSAPATPVSVTPASPQLNPFARAPFASTPPPARQPQPVPARVDFEHQSDSVHQQFASAIASPTNQLKMLTSMPVFFHGVQPSFTFDSKYVQWWGLPSRPVVGDSVNQSHY